MSGLCLVADDLTGALDSAVAFCGQFGPVPVYEHAPPHTGLPCIVIDTGTRDADAGNARRATEHLIPELVRSQIPFKKIDSLLRGPWAAELACVMESGAFSTCVFSPAFPQQGRITRLGRQMVQSADGTFSVLAISPVQELANAGLRTRIVPCGDQALAGVTAGAGEVLVFDAGSAADLSRVVDWGRQLEQRVLWCGSSGLARALAAQPSPSAPGAERPLLALIGSDHSVSKAQVGYALHRHQVDHVVIGEDPEASIASIRTALQSGRNCLATFDFPAGFDRQRARGSIRERIRRVLPAIGPPGTLLVAGGETLRSTLSAVSASHLEVDSEFSAGVPHATLRGGHWNGVGTVSKSGSFGSPGWLADFLAPDGLHTYQHSGR